jgi:hypothetical protein
MRASATWERTMAVLKYLWENRTTTLGFLQSIVAMMLVIDDIIPAGQQKWWILANGILLVALGRYNNYTLKGK